MKAVRAMSHHDAEKLLGGYAAGILTDEERTALFSAALEHQELFDALADEEALRELLADPEARRHLLALLSDPEVKRPIRLWRRPAVLGLAASLFAMVTTSVVLWQRERPLPFTPVAQKRADESKQLPATPAAEASATGKLATKGSAPERAHPGAAAKDDAPLAAPPAPIAPQASPLGAAASEGQPKMKAEASLEMKKQTAPRPQAAAVVEVISAGAAMDKSESASNYARESLERLPTNRAAGGAAVLTPGIASGNVQPSRSLPAGKNLVRPVPPPDCVLERLDNGRMRLTVTWASGHHLYVLRRGEAGIALLRPLISTPDRAGESLSTFEFPLGPKDHVDLYLLPEPASDPRALPAEGVLPGYRKRLL